MKMSVLGLGASLLSYKEIDHQGDVVLGVNDVGRHHKLDYLILMDSPSRFTPDRFKTIISTKAHVITIYKEWTYHFTDITIIEAASIRGDLAMLDSDRYPYSVNSPFVAVVHAYKMGASEIVMYGVDFLTHAALSKPEKVKKIQRHFYNLKMELKKRGVSLYLGSSESALYGFIPVIDS